VNKIATMFTFDSNTGLYNNLIRGKAYIIIDDGRSKLSKRTLWSIQELISQYKSRCHAYGGEFSREGQISLVQYKKGNWVPRSVDGTEALWESQFQQQPVDNPGIRVGASAKLSSGSHWFLSTYQIEDIK
jgi:hypothetical protein